MDDCIIVSQLEVHAQIGVPAAERGSAQRLTVSLRLIPERGLASLGDEVANTVDYANVCAAVRQEAAAKPRRLIETLAEEIAGLLLSGFPLRAVEVEVRKYVLPGTEYVAVGIRREREGT
jgi:dihydroneopterin aldolase